MHPTLSPLESIQYADMVLKGEGELALLELMQALRSGDPETIYASPNVWFRKSKTLKNLDRRMYEEHLAERKKFPIRTEEGDVIQNSLRPLIQNLDDLEFRDYVTHDKNILFMVVTTCKAIRCMETPFSK